MYKNSSNKEDVSYEENIVGFRIFYQFDWCSIILN